MVNIAFKIAWYVENYIPRKKKRTIEGALPKRTYHLKNGGEIKSQYAKYNRNI